MGRLMPSLFGRRQTDEENLYVFYCSCFDGLDFIARIGSEENLYHF